MMGATNPAVFERYYLTPYEAYVLDQFATTGEEYKVLARRLGYKVSTLKSHLSNASQVARNLGVPIDNRVQLVLWRLRNGRSLHCRRIGTGIIPDPRVDTYSDVRRTAA
jgi:DNA-binding CsgD family transcriptional regulator